MCWSIGTLTLPHQEGGLGPAQGPPPEKHQDGGFGLAHGLGGLAKMVIGGNRKNAIAVVIVFKKKFLKKPKNHEIIC